MMMNKSQFVKNGDIDRKQSHLIKAMAEGLDRLESFDMQPQGVFGREAKVVCGGVTIKSSELDFEFTVAFDDDMEANESEIMIYNLSDNTINQLKYHSSISIEAGYKGDTGVIFKGFITKVSTKKENADKVTTIKCIDDVSKKTVEEITYKAGTKASYILKDLLNRTGTPIAVFNIRRDWTYKDEQKVDGDLMENIKNYSDVCGVSTYVKSGKIYSRYIKEGENISLSLSEDTGLIGSPSPYTEEVSAEDYKETINGYECEMLLQHRVFAGAIVSLKSMYANGNFRVCSGEHRFNPNEAITKIKVY